VCRLATASREGGLHSRRSPHRRKQRRRRPWLERDEEKWNPGFRRIPLSTLGIDHVYDFGLILSKITGQCHRMAIDVEAILGYDTSDISDVLKDVDADKAIEM
jgi:hypothetical protein